MATNEAGNPLYVRMNVIDKVSTEEIQRVAQWCVEEGSTITSDGYSSYKKLKDVGYNHIFKDYYQADDDFLKWIHVIISNAKSFIQGTYHGLRQKYLIFLKHIIRRILLELILLTTTEKLLNKKSVPN